MMAPAAGVRIAFAGGLIGLGLAWSVPATAANGPPTAVYVTNSNAGTISVIDPATDSVVATIPVGPRPWAVAVSADGATAYVSDSLSSDVSVVDMRTRKVRATLAVGERPCDLVLSPDGRFLYVAVFVENVVAVIDTKSDTVVRKIPVGGVNPYALAMSPSGDTIYTANVDEADNAASTVSVIDTRSDAVTAVIGGMNGSEGVAVSPDGHAVFATSINTSVLSVIDPSTNTVTRSGQFGNGPQGVGVSPDGSAVYMANSGSDTVSVVDPTSLRLIRTVQVGTTVDEVAFSADSAHAYVTNYGSNSISDVDAATGRVLATVPVGSEPHGIAVGRLVPFGTPSHVSSIAGSLPTPREAFSSAPVVIASAAVAIGGTFFLTFPAQLFNLTFRENYDVLSEWWVALPDRFRRKSKRRALAQAATSPAAGPTPSAAPTPSDEARTAPSGPTPSDEAVTALSGPTPSDEKAVPAGEATRPGEGEPVHERSKFILVILAGALFGALLDPRFGFNSRTVESYVAIVATVTVGALLPALVTAAYHRAKAGSAPYHLEALPGGLLIAAACMLVSRLAGFQPGYLYGVVAGVAFTRTLARQQKGHVVALATLTTLTVAVIAWFVWLPVDKIAEKPGAFAGLVVADDFLGSMFAGGLVGTVIGLLPVQFLPGWTLKEWHRGVWALLFALASFGVVDVLMLSHHSHGNRTSSVVTTVVLFVVFAGGSVIFREYFVRKRRAVTGTTPKGFRAWLQELVEPMEPPTLPSPSTPSTPSTLEAGSATWPLEPASPQCAGVGSERTPVAHLGY